MRFYLLSLPLSLILSTAAFGQQDSCENNCSCTFEGEIIDGQSGEPIEFASIQIIGTSKGTSTDANGKFVLSGLCELEFDIVISHIGYKQITHHHDKSHKENTIVKLAPDNILLESVVIEGEAHHEGFSSSTVESLSSSELTQLKTKSFGEALAEISGVSVLKTGNNIAKPIVHGLHSNRVLIINNGVRHESQEWGHDHAPEIDASLADRLSIIKGANAVKYGPNALGGVIVVDPPKMELSSHLHGDFNLQYETNGRARDASLLVQKGHQNIAWLVQGAYRHQGDLEAPDYLLTNTGMLEYSGLVGFRYHLKDWDFQVYYSHTNQNLGVLRSSVTGSLVDLANAINAEQPSITTDFDFDITTPRQEVSHDFLKLEASYNFKNSRLEWKYGFQFNARKEFDVRRGTNNERPSINLELATHTFETEWLHDSWNDWNGSIGFQWFYQDNNNIPGTNTIPFIPNFNNTRAGIFVAENKQFGKYLVDVGFRYDYQTGSFRGRDFSNDIYRNEMQFHSISAMFGVTRKYEYSELKINFANAWRPPNVAEMYSFGKRIFTNEYGFFTHEIEGGRIVTERILSDDEINIPNENGYKLVADYSINKADNRLTVSPFINYIQNFIYQAPFGVSNTVRGPLPGFIYKQTDALFAGIDATFILEHGKGLSSKLSGSYLYSKDIANDDVLFGIAPNRLSYQLEWQKSIGKYQLISRAQVIHTFEQWDAPRVINPEVFVADIDFNPFVEDDSNFDFIPAPEAYTLVNTSITLEARRWSANIRLQNLLNTSYREYTDFMRYFADATGRNIEFAIQIKL